jgi:hypothetical protein
LLIWIISIKKQTREASLFFKKTPFFFFSSMAASLQDVYIIR